MAKEPERGKLSLGEVTPSGLFAHMPRWEREMKRNFGDLCSGEKQSIPKENLEMRKPPENLSKKTAQRKDKN